MVCRTKKNTGLEYILEKWDIKYLAIPYAERDNAKSKGYIIKY